MRTLNAVKDGCRGLVQKVWPGGMTSLNKARRSTAAACTGPAVATAAGRTTAAALRVLGSAGRPTAPRLPLCAGTSVGGSRYPLPKPPHELRNAAKAAQARLEQSSPNHKMESMCAPMGSEGQLSTMGY